MPCVFVVVVVVTGAFGFILFEILMFHPVQSQCWVFIVSKDLPNELIFSS